jgi:hypothetical protein
MSSPTIGSQIPNYGNNEAYKHFAANKDRIDLPGGKTEYTCAVPLVKPDGSVQQVRINIVVQNELDTKKVDEFARKLLEYATTHNVEMKWHQLSPSIVDPNRLLHLSNEERGAIVAIFTKPEDHGLPSLIFTTEPKAAPKAAPIKAVGQKETEPKPGVSRFARTSDPTQEKYAPIKPAGQKGMEPKPGVSRFARTSDPVQELKSQQKEIEENLKAAMGGRAQLERHESQINNYVTLRLFEVIIPGYEAQLTQINFKMHQLEAPIQQMNPHREELKMKCESLQTAIVNAKAQLAMLETIKKERKIEAEVKQLRESIVFFERALQEMKTDLQ